MGAILGMGLEGEKTDRDETGRMCELGAQRCGVCYMRVAKAKRWVMLDLNPAIWKRSRLQGGDAPTELAVVTEMGLN